MLTARKVATAPSAQPLRSGARRTASRHRGRTWRTHSEYVIRVIRLLLRTAQPTREPSAPRPANAARPAGLTSSPTSPPSNTEGSSTSSRGSPLGTRLLPSRRSAWMTQRATGKTQEVLRFCPPRPQDHQQGSHARREGGHPRSFSRTKSARRKSLALMVLKRWAAR